MNSNPPLTLVVCASASFYKDVIEFSYQLEARGINVMLPKTAEKMKRNQGENIEAITDWSSAGVSHHDKALLIREHFDEITKGDAVLVINYRKHGKENYIGPNVLMEMAVAFHLKKPIYILNGQPSDSPLIDEILGLEPVFLHGDITKLP